MSASSVALAERAYQHALAYARERVQSVPAGDKSAVPKSIIHHADVRRMLMEMKSRPEALRALLYWTAAQMDHAQHNPDAALREKAQATVDFMIPVVKGWCTESSIEIASTGIQIHGGVGFIEETGASQYLRDARITTIYEGTTGIQGNDLIGRKLTKEKSGPGATAKSLQRRRQRHGLRPQSAGDLRQCRRRRAAADGAAEFDARQAVRSGYGAVIVIAHASTLAKDKNYEKYAGHGSFTLNDDPTKRKHWREGIREFLEETLPTGMRLSSSPVIPDDDLDAIGLQWLLVAQSDCRRVPQDDLRAHDLRKRRPHAASPRRWPPPPPATLRGVCANGSRHPCARLRDLELRRRKHPDGGQSLGEVLRRADDRQPGLKRQSKPGKSVGGLYRDSGQRRSLAQRAGQFPGRNDARL